VERVSQEIDFAGQASQGGHGDFADVVRENELGDEERVRQIGERVVKILCRMDLLQSAEVGFSVRADFHFVLTVVLVEAQYVAENRAGLKARSYNGLNLRIG